MANEEASSPSPAQSWVDRMVMAPLSDSLSPSASNGATSQTSSDSRRSQDDHGVGHSEFNIASLNVLAEGYLTPRSHPGLPQSYADVAFDPTKRRRLLLETLQRFCHPSDETKTTTKWDIVALQELDLLQTEDLILPAFESWGYQVVRTPDDQRKDCCAIAFDTRKFSLVKMEVVRFDDLTTLQNNTDDDENGNKTQESNSKQEDPKSTSFLSYHDNLRTKKPDSPSELSGMVRSFLRRNCAVVAHLESIETKESIVVSSVHLYWHPGYEYVKLCQTKYLLDRVASFASIKEKDSNVDDSTISTNGKNGNERVGRSNGRIPTIICGDMNSKPGSIVHKLFVSSHVDGRAVAPWRYFWDQDNEENYSEDEEKKDEVDDDYSNKDGDRMDGQDPIVADTSSNLAGSAAISNGETGYMMSGLPADFNMFCGVTNSGTQCLFPSELAEPSVVPKNEKSTENSLSSLLSEENANSNKNKNNTYDALKTTFTTRSLNGHMTPQDYQHSTPSPPVKYMLDYTLNRFTRWLRILGIDAVLETVEQEHDRTHGGKIAMFDRCKKEHRTLITTSYKLLLRKECPPGAYLLDPKSTSHLLEQVLPRLLRTHGVHLSPCTFLTRCVVCNGNIHRVQTTEEKRAVFEEHGAPDLMDSKEDMEVFRCDGCRQGYWWGDKPTSSASRVFNQATKLLRLCLRGGVELKDEKSISDEKKRKELMGAFDFVDIAKERQHEDSVAKKTQADLSVMEWLRDEKLSNPFHLRSAYAGQGDAVREYLPFTNVTKEFVGCLDYVFFEPLQFDQICRLKVPTSFRDMNVSGAPSGHLIPSDIWPSDHIAVGARLRLKQQTNPGGNSKIESRKIAPSPKSNETNGNTNSETIKPTPHDPKCACGCVPQILSLFEMAELRKKLREEKKKKAEAEAQSKLPN